ncbi:putative ribonuclease h protein [Quercus suber]|uniref:Ribonuclease h protein n=1 Tax=Quercus suber TaxID=58331 RepID=A0AAW0JEX4_QUESU
MVQLFVNKVRNGPLEDKWLNLGTVRECIEGPLQKGEAELRVCDIHTNGMWELHKISFIFPTVLSKSIKATPIRTASASDDRLSWIASPRGEFDPKSAYLIACGANASDGCFQGAWIWKLNSLPKIQVFLWKCYFNSIPVKAILTQRGLQMSPCCDLCHNMPETISHVFRECTAARAFWADSNMPDEMQNTFALEIVDWIKLWLNRNKRLFQPSQTPRNLFKSVEAQFTKKKKEEVPTREFVVHQVDGVNVKV